MIEIILVLVVAAIMFAMMFAYFNRSLMDSARPVGRLNQSMSLTSVAERITGHYIEGNRTSDVLDKISDNLKDLSNTFYGDNFTVDTNEFITFTNNNDEPYTADAESNTTPKTLKITIRHKVTNETLTLLLTDWSRTSQ